MMTGVMIVIFKIIITVILNSGIFFSPFLELLDGLLVFVLFDVAVVCSFALT